GAYIKKMIQNTGAQIRIDNSDYNRVKRNTISSSEGDPRPTHPEAPEEEQKVPAPEKETDQEKNLEGDKQEGKSDLAVPQKSPEPEAVAESSKTPEANGGEKEAGKAPEANRLVTITGIDGQISNALYYIFDKVAEQIFSPLEELRLHSEITVPSSLVGRIIGKSGQNVRELQRITQAVVKIPEDAHRSEAPVANFDEEPLSTVRIDGCCFATQAVEIRINQLVFEHRQRCLASLQRQPNCDSWQQGQPAASPRPQS
uniref:KH domain-containing protein n=1 Tax=Steinernema glaseri TaxID=37863 RepID=A0A1I7ZG61_9BILA